MQERLQKIIARAGIASRRHAEKLIQSGLVTVNGQTVTELGTKADESTDHIKVSGKLLRPAHDRVYLLLNKPPEVVSTMSDPEGRRSLQDLLHGVPQRVFPVGRLEYHSTGLVFLTNDGDLAHRMLKAHYLRQTYLLKLKTLLTFEEIEQLARSTGARISRLRGKESPWYEVTLSDARRDSLRNKLFQTGHPVEKIKRIRIANLELESLPLGHHRKLSPAEVASLSRALEGKFMSDPDVAEKRKPVIGEKRGLASAKTSFRPARKTFRDSSRKPFERREVRGESRSGSNQGANDRSRRGNSRHSSEKSADQPSPVRKTRHDWPKPRKSR